jgi:tungstate transport system substrate-binding protein
MSGGGNRCRVSVGIAVLCFELVASGVARAETITLASTTSVENSGLLAHILPEFTKATGIEVRVVAVGTGEALDTARRGEADLVLVHDPKAEDKFMLEGDGFTRREVAWNDFIVVGPSNDPAHIAGGHDAVSALKAIAADKAPFVSRGDRSGTDALEKRLWRYAKIEPVGSWYRETHSGMAATLKAASEMHAYTISDRGTWLSFKSSKGNLEVMVEGDTYLINHYDVILLDPKRHPEAKIDAAYRLADWLLSPVGQAAIGSYKIDGEQLFHPFATER